MQKDIIKLSLFMILLLSGCDLFTTRDPENPDENRANFLPPKEPAVVIENLKNSFNDKNTQNYIACFVDTLFVDKAFIFLPSSEAVSAYAFLAQDWGLDDERRYFNSVVAKVPKDFPMTLTFSDESYSSLSGDTLIYSANYFINIPHNSSEPKNYSGNLQFNMIRDSRSDWAIYYWKDTRSSNLPSWSEMKGIFYQ